MISIRENKRILDSYYLFVECNYFFQAEDGIRDVRK